MYRKLGFTLMELMIASAILAVVMAGLVSSFVSCILLNNSNANLTAAVNDAQYVLEQIKGLTYTQIAAYTPPQFNNLKNEAITLTSSIGAKIAEVTVNVSWLEIQRQGSIQLSTHVAR